ncbi:hypothetical protein SAMD00019534_027280 [Acytostelium subglobosum LB1]|uniref:hypothetical protein n=1 Tax=Acytostelium subglobosum LB1 TaxID=1410327 RepID=UPI000644CA51|nr:hypothetical protein SAMD00019534_027280 [Acytostelium subglobosum LB1]GAM19553.1 hypothetical protein SAMD00019534_027280 [Acytostelium subglobosum LB1]|eukprot:XP_012757480.1 hypothetical protein SAMD00019534_027280 [Acytostelium subglobosum LB1]
MSTLTQRALRSTTRFTNINTQRCLFNQRSRFYSNNNNNNFKNTSSSSRIGWIVGAGIVVAATTSVAIAADEQSSFDKSQTLREKIVNRYQDKIREYSTPEKIFQTFASVKKNGESFMTLDDFVRAILPSQFRESTQTSLKGLPLNVRNVPLSFQIADIDGDGLISFSEFIFFSTLLSIPEKSVEIAFQIMDVNHDNSIDVNEFTKIFKLLKNQSAFASTSTSSKALLSQGWVNYLFGKHGDNSLSVERFKLLLDQVRRDVLQLEFNMYDTTGSGFISQRDFGRLIASYSNFGQRDQYLKAITSLPATVTTQNKGISFDQFVSFNKILNKLDEVGLSIDLYKGINQPFTKNEFKYVSKVIASFEPSKEMVDTIYTIFDSDNNGDLSKDEFVEVMKRRKYRGLENNRDSGFIARLEKVYQVIIGKL